MTQSTTEPTVKALLTERVRTCLGLPEDGALSLIAQQFIDSLVTQQVPLEALGLYTLPHTGATVWFGLLMGRNQNYGIGWRRLARRGNSPIDPSTAFLHTENVGDFSGSWDLWTTAYGQVTFRADTPYELPEGFEVTAEALLVCVLLGGRAAFHRIARWLMKEHGYSMELIRHDPTVATFVRAVMQEGLQARLALHTDGSFGYRSSLQPNLRLLLVPTPAGLVIQADGCVASTCVGVLPTNPIIVTDV
jgi:hypothetical protein